MASIHLHSDRLEIRLTAAEKALSLRRDNVEIPRSSIRSATLTDDPWIWVRGVRGRGAAIPLTLAVGQWKSHGGADFLVIKKGSRPAVVLDVEDEEFSRVIVSTNHGAELVAALRIVEDEIRAKKVRATRVRTVSPRPIAVRAKAEAAKIEAAKVKADAKADSAAKSGGRDGVAKKAASRAATQAAGAKSGSKASTARPSAARSSTSKTAAGAAGSATPASGATATRKTATEKMATAASAAEKEAAGKPTAEKSTTRGTAAKAASETKAPGRKAAGRTTSGKTATKKDTSEAPEAVDAPSRSRRTTAATTGAVETDSSSVPRPTRSRAPKTPVEAEDPDATLPTDGTGVDAASSAEAPDEDPTTR